MFIDPVTSLEEFFIDIHIPFDCEFLVAEKSNAAGEGVMSLTEIYRVQPTQLLQTYRLGNWSSATGLTWSTVPFNQRRGDLQGVTIKAAVRADVRKTTNTLAKFLILGNVTLITTFKTGSIDVDKIVLQVKVFWVVTACIVVVGYQLTMMSPSLHHPTVNGSSMALQNTGMLLQHYTMSQSRRPELEFTLT